MGKSVEIRLLGELEVLQGGRAAPLPASKKTRALLGYLAATARPHLRTTLCELLWPGPDDPRAALRWSLTKIRALVDERGAARIVADRDRAGFAPEGARVDLAEVRAALSAAPTELATSVLRDVAACFRGELLEGLELPDIYRFQEWLAGEREQVRSLRVKVLGTLVDRLAGEPEEALRFARQRVVVDPLSEAAHVAVVRLLAQLGKKREALDQFEACARILSTELHAKPGPALLAARMMLSASQAPPAARAPDPSPHASVTESSTPSPAPLVGRAREIAAIDAAIGRGSGVLLFAGEPGIGKSRLLGELAERSASRGARVLRGRAYEAERVRPYGVWIDALRPVALGPSPEALRAELAPLFPELGPLGAPSDRARLFDAVVRLLASLAPVVVVLDDLQWFDEASAALLHLVARAKPARVLLACGARAEELGDNPAVLRLVRALAKDERLARVDVAPLDEEATAALARAIDPRADAARVRHDSAGNPLFAIEVTRALVADGGEAREAPSSLAAIIGERLARLDDAARELLPWAAALGRTFDEGALARVTGLPTLTLTRGLEELERRGIVRASDGGAEYDFVHDLVRDGAYRQLSAPRRRLVHGQIARTLGAGPTIDDARAGDVAQHAALGGERELAARAYLAAAERALRVFAPADAVRLADAGIDCAAGLSRDARVALDLGLLRVKTMATGLVADREALGGAIARAVADAQAAGRHADAAAGLHTLSILQSDAGDSTAAWVSTIRAAEVVGRADDATRARQLSDTARCLGMLEREMGRAEGMLGEARAILGADADAGLHFAWGQGLLHRFRGEASRGRVLLERALGLARAAEDHWAECECAFVLTQLELEESEAPRAAALCEDVLPVAQKMGEGSEEPVARALSALACVAASDGVEGRERLDAAIARLRQVDAKGMLAYVLNFAASIELARGRREAARTRASEALRAAEAVVRRTQVVLARAVLGRVAVAEGDRATAVASLEAARADLAAPLGVSARAHAAARDLAAALEASVTPEGSPACRT